MLVNDHDNNPQWINTEQGWNWSYIPLPANNSFDWMRPDGSTGYLYGAMCQISLSRDNPDIVYMVANIAETGPMNSELDANGDGIEDDPCGEQDWPWELYPEWSEDVWVAKSLDNGSTWSKLENLTQTPRDMDAYPTEQFNQNCSPEEQLVHTAHWSDDERVYYQFHQPNWGFNEIGDLIGADHMNRVWLGYSWVTGTDVFGCTDQNNCSYDPDATADDGSCGVGTFACDNGDSGCGCAGECADGLEPPTIVGCDGVCDSGAVMLCNSILNGGGEYCADPGTDICSESNFNDEACGPGIDYDDTENINEWDDCGGDHCGVNDPLFYDTGCADAGFNACDGGRCYTCENPSYTSEGACVGAGFQWSVETVGGCDSTDWGFCADSDCNNSYQDCVGTDPDDPGTPDVDEEQCASTWTICEDVVTDEASCSGEWVTFADDGANETGDPDECYCFLENTNGGAEYECEVACVLADVNGDGGWNVLDIVGLANCVLGDSCDDADDGGCASDVNGDGTWNVLDIVALANCVLADSCGGRVDDASESTIIKKDNTISIVADGFIGGVQMTLKHGDDFSIKMTDRALDFAGYLTTGNETRLLVITPETEELFSYSGDFEISEIIVANSQYEVSVDMPIATSFTLSDAYPNPFNPTTTMTLTMPVSGEITVEVYNVLGQVVATLASGYMDASTPHELTWDASNASSGVYFVQADTEGFTKTQKLMLVK